MKKTIALFVLVAIMMTLIPLTNVEMTSNPDSDELQSEKTPQPTINVVTEQIPQTGESSNQAIVGIILLVLAAGTALLMYAIKKSKPAKD